MDSYNKNHLKQAHADLIRAVKSAHWRPERQLSIFELYDYPQKTEVCLRLNLPCLRTINSNYAFSQRLVMELTSDEVVAVVGNNHTVTVKSIYTSLTLYDSAIAGQSFRAMTTPCWEASTVT